MNVYFFTRQGGHVQRAVAEPAREYLSVALLDNDVIGSVIGSSIADLDGGPFLHPFLAGLVHSQRIARLIQQHGGGMANCCLEIMASDKLSQQKTDDVRRLPVAGMEQVGQTVGGKVGQALRAIEGVVDATSSPPFGL